MPLPNDKMLKCCCVTSKGYNKTEIYCHCRANQKQHKMTVWVSDCCFHFQTFSTKYEHMVLKAFGYISDLATLRPCWIHSKDCMPKPQRSDTIVQLYRFVHWFSNPNKPSTNARHNSAVFKYWHRFWGHFCSYPRDTMDDLQEMLKESNCPLPSLQWCFSTVSTCLLLTALQEHHCLDVLGHYTLRVPQLPSITLWGYHQPILSSRVCNDCHVTSTTLMWHYVYQWAVWSQTHTCLTICLNGSRDVLAEALVDIEHVKVNPSQLDDKRVSHSLTGSDVGLQDAAQLFHRLWVLQDVHVLKGGDDEQQEEGWSRL